MNNNPQDPIIVLQNDSPDVLYSRSAHVQVAVYSKRSPAKETPNEDSAAVVPAGPEATLFVVADGVGGHKAGEVASQIAIDSLASQLHASSSIPGTGLRANILNGIESANASIQALNLGAATTIAVVELNHGQVRPYHVGDTGILMVSSRGNVCYQSISHSPVGFAVESGLLDEDEALLHEDRHFVSNVVGDPAMRIEVGPTIRLAPRDTVLLASDGLFDNLTIDLIVETIRKGPLKKSVKLLADMANSNMQLAPAELSKPDDLTILAFRRYTPRAKSANKLNHENGTAVLRNSLSDSSI
ncbi:MAG: serine/threonine-protein phosphatase [Planctomycetales bacterium]|nr:serine/threonine-protein phosphatase [Planctomycetales bacterium]